MAGGAKIKKAATKVKGLIGSIKGDANAFNSAFGFGGNFSNKFDQRLKDGLDDLLGGALGIRMSQVPEISGAVLKAKEAARIERQEAISGKPRLATSTPTKQLTLQYPINYFKEDKELIGKSNQRGGLAPKMDFPNSIHFRTLHRKEQDHSEGMATDDGRWYTTERGVQRRNDRKAKRGQQSTYGGVYSDEEINYDIFLHLPEKLTDEVKVEYSEAKAGMLQQFFARMFAGKDRDAVNDMQGKRNFDANEIMQVFKDMMPGGEIVQKAAGHMTNPMVFQTLKNVNFRSYAYSFQLRPTSPREADVIREIVFAFKKSMLPGTAGENNMIWTLPNEWAIQFQGPIADWVDFPLTAVCTSVTVDYGQYLMAGDSRGDGAGAPGTITLALNFIETAQLSRQKFEWEVGAMTGRESRAEEGTLLGPMARFTDEERNAAIKGGLGSGGGG